MEILYKIEKVTDLEGKLKEGYLTENNKKAHYKIDWHGAGDVVHLWNHNKEIDHIGMRTSYAELVVEEDDKAIITTMNSVYHLIRVNPF